VVAVTIERLSAEDRMLLLSDKVWPQDVGVVVILGAGHPLDSRGQLPIELARKAVEPGLSGLPRLRQVVHVPAWGLGGPLWVEAPGFDLAQHVRLGPPVDPEDEAALAEAVEQIRSRRLDLSRPLWELWLLPGAGAGGMTLFVRMHHDVADGVAGVARLAALLGEQPRTGTPEKPAWLPGPAPSRRELLADNLCRRGRAIGRGLAALRHPRTVLRSGVEAWRATRELVSGEPGPVTSLGGLVGPHRRLSFVRASLADLEEVAHARGATVNDVLLASMAGGVRALLTSRGQTVDHLSVPVLVPVSLRRGTPDAGWGNRISQLRVPLPVGEPDADERLRRITEATSRAKALSHPSLGLAFSNRVLGAIVLRLVVRQRINLLSADIVGPAQPLSFAGVEVREVFPLINLLGNVTLGVGALSYAGRFEVLVVADADLYPDLDAFAAGAAAELRTLSTAASAKDLRP
jgi:WS/DGAT/MGAT family acyltransferase